MRGEDAFVALVGERLIHRTLVRNARGIEACGLLAPATLARRGGVDPQGIVLRADRRVIRFDGVTAQLNHQGPLRAGRRQEAAFLDGHSLESWAEQLDRRVFFWPGRRGSAFGDSLTDAGGVAEYAVSARALYRRFADRIDLAPINSGNATRRATLRGDWIYTPAPRSHDFPRARMARGLARTPDRVAEVSLRGDLSPDDLAACLWERIS